MCDGLGYFFPEVEENMPSFLSELGDLRAGKNLGKSDPKATETKGSFYAGRSLEEHHLPGLSRLLDGTGELTLAQQAREGMQITLSLNRGVFPFFGWLLTYSGCFV